MTPAQLTRVAQVLGSDRIKISGDDYVVRIPKDGRAEVFIWSDDELCMALLRELPAKESWDALTNMECELVLAHNARRPRDFLRAVVEGLGESTSGREQHE